MGGTLQDSPFGYQVRTFLTPHSHSLIKASSRSTCRMIGQCQALVAEAVAAFGKVDILLCCTSQSKESILLFFEFYFMC
jgi:hypothetical protein